MEKQQPSIGRIVHYRLTEEEAGRINRSRYSAGPREAGWPEGAQAHIGNRACAGDTVPLIIVRVWPNEFGTEPGVNGQALLDGNDALWVTSAKEGAEQGQWSWPPRT